MTTTTESNEKKYTQHDTDHLLKKIKKLEKELDKKLITLCLDCQAGNVILSFKKYLNQYVGMCDNKECKMNLSIGVVK